MSTGTPLDGIKHIVVVMMENRSFDHMLGYLRHDGHARGQRPHRRRVQPRPRRHEGPGHRRSTPTPTRCSAPARRCRRSSTRITPSAACRSRSAPASATSRWAGSSRPSSRRRKPADKVGRDLWIVPMGYYTGKDLPVYDYLARTFCVCDAGTARCRATPGRTGSTRWPAARATRSAKLGLLRADCTRRSRRAPIYDVAAFTRHLDDAQWRWYSHDPATLRAADSDTASPRTSSATTSPSSIARRSSWSPSSWRVPIVGRTASSTTPPRAGCATSPGSTRTSSTCSVLDPNSNDDHPPSDIRAGQAFVLDDRTRRWSRSPTWNDTLLVIVYDEHGGFYDHVSRRRPADDDAGYATLGVRVPALFVGPRVSAVVCHELFDHTSADQDDPPRFADNPAAGDRADAPARRRSAPHLGVVLQDEPRTDIPGPDDARATIDAWRQKARASRQARSGRHALPGARRRGPAVRAARLPGASSCASRRRCRHDGTAARPALVSRRAAARAGSACAR